MRSTCRALAAPSQAPPGERRIALVIGNSAYKSSPLKNPVRDARAISKALAAGAGQPSGTRRARSGW